MKALLAVNKLGVIGLGKKLPWKSKDDLNHFKSLTLHSKCLVGRKTYEGLPLLKDRTLVIVGHGKDYYYETIEEAIKKEGPIDWVIGGKSIYEQTLSLCDELHLSIINDYSTGDVMCPDLNSFNGEIFIYNFDTNPVTITKSKASDIIGNIIPQIEEKTKLISKWEEYLKGLDKFPQMQIVCRHDVLEQQLIKNGLTKEQASKFPRHIVCPCPKCSPKYFL